MTDKDIRCRASTIVELNGRPYRFRCEIDMTEVHPIHRSFIGEREDSNRDEMYFKQANVAWANRGTPDILTSLNKILAQTSPS